MTAETEDDIVEGLDGKTAHDLNILAVLGPYFGHAMSNDFVKETMECLELR